MMVSQDLQLTGQLWTGVLDDFGLGRHGSESLALIAASGLLSCGQWWCGGPGEPCLAVLTKLPGWKRTDPIFA